MPFYILATRFLLKNNIQLGINTKKQLSNSGYCSGVTPLFSKQVNQLIRGAIKNFWLLSEVNRRKNKPIPGRLKISIFTE
jgi:hypothetical protein